MDTDMPSEWGAGGAVASPPPPSPPGYAPAYPPPTAYGPPGPVGDRSADGVAVAALVVGIASVPLFWAFGLVALAAVILGGIALGRTASGRREGRGMALAGTILGAISLTTFIVWALVLGLQKETKAESGRSTKPAPVEETAPAPPEETAEIPRPTSDISLDQVFAPVPGYVMTEAPAADVAAIREQVESEPAANAVIADLGGRDVRQNGRRIARIYATTFDGAFAEAPELGEGFIEGAAAELLTRQDTTIGGLPAVSGTDDEGNAVIIVYKNTVGVVVGGPNMVALEQFTTKLLANIPAAS